MANAKSPSLAQINRKVDNNMDSIQQLDQNKLYLDIIERVSDFKWFSRYGPPSSAWSRHFLQS